MTAPSHSLKLPAGVDPAPKVNILLVDDQPANLLALEAILADLGHNLVKAGSGDEALRRLLEQDFAVILLDVQMQGLDGFETAKLVRSRERSRHTPIIFITAYEDDRFPVDQAYALGAVDYLVKPLVPVILRAKVRSFVELFEKTEQIKRQAEQLRQLERREFEQRLAEENARLQESEIRFRSIIEHGFDAVVLITAEGIARYVSPSITRILGYAVEEFVGQNVFTWIHPDDLPRTAAIFAQVLRQPGATLSAQFRYRHKDGTWRWLEGTGTNLLEEPAVRAVVGNFHDITEQQQAQEVLRQSERQFRTLADSIPQLAWMARPDGYIVWYNQRWYDYTGTTPEQMAGWGWQSVHDPAELPRVLANWKAALASGKPWEDTFPLRRHDGALRWHLSRALPLRDDQGRVLWWFGTNTDITERLQMEEALREADRRKDEFLAMLAHELRNPLAPIRNAVEVLRLLGAGDPNLRRSRDMIERQVQHLTRLVDDLLEVSRITSGKINLHKEPLELTAVIARAVEMNRPLIDSREQQLAVAVPPEPVWLEADPTRLAQVIGNLLNNAAKYTEKGGRIWLAAERDGGEAVVRVRDTGLGIGPELLPHVFDLFTQGDRSLARSEGGLGIGLTLVKRLVEMHGGSVEARSEGTGKGSEFVVRLPLLKAGPIQLVNSHQGGEKRPHSPPRRVLVVDDSADAAESLAMFLKVEGHEVRTAYDGPTALQVAQAFRPEAVFLDIGLPGMDGYEVARRLRDQVGLTQVFLAAVTGYGQEEDRRRAEEAGFDAHLVKPADPTVVQQLLAG